MGQYFRAVCHTCKVAYRPSAQKIREIQLSKDCCAMLGLFMAQHAGCLVELRGDEHTRSSYVGSDDALSYEKDKIETEETWIKENP